MKKIYAKKFWSEHDGNAIAIIPKVGNTSFSEIVDGGRLTSEEALQFKIRVMFIREPIERVISNYSFFHALNDNEECRTNIPKEITHNGYEVFIDYILLDKGNPHWAPQMELTDGIATHLYKFNCDNIRKYWPMHWSGRQPNWMNATTHLEVNDYRMKELLEFYVKDTAAYESAI